MIRLTKQQVISLHDELIRETGIFLEVAADSTDFNGLLQWLLDHERG